MTQVRLIHGDCLEIMPTLEAGSVDCVIADLPYGTTACKWDTVIPFLPLWAAYRHVLKPNGAVVLFGSQPFTSALVMSNPTEYRHSWVWHKSRATGHLNAKRRPLREHEDVMVFCRETPAYHPQMLRGFSHKRGGTRTGPAQVYGKFADRQTTQHTDYYPKSILSFDAVLCPIHPTQKPVSLLTYLTLTYTNAGDTVLDNCFGSGTTGVACMMTGRNFIGIERDESYFCAASKRIADAQSQGNLFADESA